MTRRCYLHLRRCLVLDAYIIDRIRRERDRDREEGAFVPLRIEPPGPRSPHTAPAEAPRDERDDENERGSVVVDFTL
jgi:hypothetical protein